MINIKWEQKINSEDYTVRERFAEYLGRRKNILRAPKLLMRLLKDRESLVRSAAINSLMKIGNKKYFQKMLSLLNDTDEMVRVNAVECVACLGGKRAIKFLVTPLNDRSELVRRYAGGWLGEIGDKTTSKYLEKRLKQERSSLAKVGLVEGLYLLGQQERLPEFIRLFKSRRYRVRCAVANTLVSLINKENKVLIRKALINALKIESTIAARSSMENALGKLGERKRGRTEKKVSIKREK